MSMIRSQLSRAVRATAPRPFYSITQTRTYAKKNMSAEGGQASPGTASNVADPSSAAAAKADMTSARSPDSKGSPDTKSVQSPIDDPKGAANAQREGDTDTQEAFKQDPNKSDSEKRKNVEEMGKKPLDGAQK